MPPDHDQSLPHSPLPTGYHGNKLSYLWSLAKLGFTFHVHPQVVVMHLPHPPVQEAADMTETEKMRVVRVGGAGAWVL